MCMYCKKLTADLYGAPGRSANVGNDAVSDLYAGDQTPITDIRYVLAGKPSNAGFRIYNFYKDISSLS